MFKEIEVSSYRAARAHRHVELAIRIVGRARDNTDFRSEPGEKIRQALSLLEAAYAELGIMARVGS